MIKYIYWLIFRKKVKNTFPEFKSPPAPQGRRPTSFSDRLEEKIREAKEKQDLEIKMDESDFITKVH